MRMYLMYSCAFLVFLTGPVTDAKNTYASYMMKYVRPGIPAQLSVEIFKSNNPVMVEATLSSANFTSIQSVVIEEGEIKLLEFDEIPLDYKGQTNFDVEVVGRDRFTGEEVFRNRTQSHAIIFQRKFLSIFIQTDKAIYQPSQTIKFRAVITTPDLLPYNGKATYTLKDPKNNIILMVKDAELVYGVVGSNFTLGRYSNIGTWTLTYAVQGHEESLSLVVQEYKLPKFQVEIETDESFLELSRSEDLSGVFYGKYTFGELVKGMARLEVGRSYRQGGKLPQYILQKYEVTEGMQRFSIPIKEIQHVMDWEDYMESLQIHLRVSLTEKNTREKKEASTTITLYKRNVKVEVVAKPATCRPGLPYKAYLKVTQQNGTIFPEDYYNSVRFPYAWLGVTVDYSSVPQKRELHNIRVQKDGYAVLDITADSGKYNDINFAVRLGKVTGTISVVDRDSKPRTEANWRATRFLSPSSTYLQIGEQTSSYSVGDTFMLEVFTTEKAEKYSLMVMSRGKIVLNDVINVRYHVKNEKNYMFTHKFLITSEMSPRMFVIVSFTRFGGEIVADGKEMIVQSVLKNKVVLSTSTDKTDVGTEVSITVESAPRSFIGLRAIDRSVLLLRRGNDITQNKIFHELDRYGTTKVRPWYWLSYTWWCPWWCSWWCSWWCPWRYPWWHPRPWWYWNDANDVAELFHDFEMVIMTDAFLYSETPVLRQPFESRVIGAGMGSSGMAMFESARRSEDPQKSDDAAVVRTRTRFPESWIWTDGYTGSNGSTTFTYKTPDTITTWELSSFAISETRGLGVTEQNSNITVFRNFFIHLDLPPSLVRDEILNMRVVIFNYHDTPQRTVVTLQNSKWYELVIVGDDAWAAGRRRIIRVPSKSSVTVVFPIQFKKAGLAPISVLARSRPSTDKIEKKLLVKPEGILITEKHNLLIETERWEDEKLERYVVDFPRDIVSGSAGVRISVSGNIIGNSLKNLGSLLRIPGGCGEQIMVAFAPDIYVSLYLLNSGQLTSTIAEISKSHIRHGYQNIFRYQHSDGSFSAFGPADNHGNTWLTAFVVKVLTAAKRLDSDLVQDEIIQKAVKFILKQQSKEGSFIERGSLITTNIQGGIESNETLTAYIIIALMEEKYFEKDKDVQAAVNSAKIYLERKAISINNLYTLTVVTYALTLAESRVAGRMMNEVDSRATEEDNFMFWTKPRFASTKCDKNEKHCLYPEHDSASAVEMTSYALLTYLEMERRSEVLPIVRWLAQQRGVYGGFYSTQDTVMGIQALSAIADANRDLDLTLVVTHDADRRFEKEFRVRKQNSIILQQSELPSLPGTVGMSVVGEGVADVQVVVSYNFPGGPRADEPFNVKVTVRESDHSETVMLRICASINEDRDEVLEETGMFVIVVDLISGYTVDDSKATEQNPWARLIELVGEEVTGYFEKLEKGGTACMNLELTRYAKVSEAKPRMIKAFDYYNPGRIAVRQYGLKKMEGVCYTCGTECVGCPEPPRTEIVDGKETFVNFYCEEAQFPCPEFSEGLFYDPESQVANLLQTPEYAYERLCSLSRQVKRTPRYPGPPGTYLDGRGSSVSCGGTNIFAEALKKRAGFTVALLLYPMTERDEDSYTIFTVGKKGHTRPQVALKKDRNSYQVKVLVYGAEYTTTFSYYADDQLKTWTHILIKFGHGPFPDLFINNGKLNAVKDAKWPLRPSTELDENIGLDIGVDFKGVVSSLDFWDHALTDLEAQHHFEYYLDMMLEENPLLTEGQAQHVVPDSLWPCLEKEYMRASALKAAVGREIAY